MFKFLNFFLFKVNYHKKIIFWTVFGCGSNRIPLGSNRVLLTTWVRTGYCGVHGRMAPPPSFKSLWTNFRVIICTELPKTDETNEINNFGNLLRTWTFNGKLINLVKCKMYTWHLTLDTRHLTCRHECKLKGQS